MTSTNTMRGASPSAAEMEGASVLAQRNGARAVVATLWPVADVSTRLVMETFYRARQQSRLTKAAALREAQLALLHGTAPGKSRPPFTHPYYWAPFILVGNWK